MQKDGQEYEMRGFQMDEKVGSGDTAEQGYSMSPVSIKDVEVPFANGKIKPGHHCPWSDQCGDAKDGSCYRPKVISVEFSCGFARMFYVITGGLPKNVNTPIDNLK